MRLQWARRRAAAAPPRAHAPMSAISAMPQNTHSPAAGIGDGPDEPHKGFEGFNYLLEKYKPKYFIHGHIHRSYQMKFKQEYEYNENTKIINGYERYIFEYPDV